MIVQHMLIDRNLEVTKTTTLKFIIPLFKDNQLKFEYLFLSPISESILK